MRMLLATCAALPAGEPGGGNLISAFDALGLESEWVRWDDPSIDWSSGLTCVRATWDYTSRLQEFLAWARRVPRMLNSADAFEWNTDKSYLLELAASGLPIIVAVTELAVTNELMTHAVAANLVAAGSVSLLVFPYLAARLRARTAAAQTAGSSG